MDWFIKQIYILMHKKGWRVKHIEYMGDNNYHVELTKEDGDYFITILYPKYNQLTPTV